MKATDKTGYTRPKISDLKKRIAELEKQHANDQKWIGKLKGINESLADDIDRLNEKNERLDAIIKAQASNIEYVTKCRDAHMEEVEDLKNKLERVYSDRNLWERIINKRLD